MQSALSVRADQTQWSTEQLAVLRQLGVDKATAGDLAVFLNFAQKTGLDPFARQIYMIGRWDNRAKATRWTIQASIDGLRVVAQRSGDYQGQAGPLWCGDDGEWMDVWLESTPPRAAKVGVLRSGFSQPLWAVAMWEEYAVDGPMWKKMPSLMLAKCAEALALRKAFPNDLSGIYTTEEMAQAHAGAPRAAPEPMLTLDELVLSIEVAETEDELRQCWKAAHRAGALEEDAGDGVTVGDMIQRARVMLGRSALEEISEPVVEGELVESE